MGQEGILLRPIEAVDFVDEKNRAGSVLARPLSLGHDLLDFLDTRQHGGELDELSAGHGGDDLGKRGLARAGGSPEEHGAGIVSLHLQAQRLALADEMFLADEFLERARAHAVGKRALRDLGVGSGLEEVHAFELRCRAASYRIMLAAIPALSDSTGRA